MGDETLYPHLMRTWFWSCCLSLS